MSRLSPNARRPAIATLTVEEASAALSALVNGRQDIPPLAELRSMVERRRRLQAARPRSTPSAVRPILMIALFATVDGEVQIHG